MPATVLLIRIVDVNDVVACSIAARNNKMIPLIAKYFFRFLHELTVSSLSVTIVFWCTMCLTDDISAIGR